MRHDPLDEFSILFIRRDLLNKFSEIDASTKHHPPAFIAICHHQQQEPSWTFSCDATVVLVRETWFVHRSDSLVLTFWQLESSLNERDVAPTSLPAKCRTFPRPSR